MTKHLAERQLAAQLSLAYQGERQLAELGKGELARSAYRLLTVEPQRYCAIATALMDGHSVNRIKKELHIDPELVRFIRQMHPELLIASRQQLVANLEEVALAMTQALLERGSEIDPEKLPAALGQVLDKLSVLSGGVTARVEHVSVPKPEDLERMFKALPAAVEVQEGK
jgi:hypothetical protein